MTENISEDLKEILIRQGAALVGFGDIREFIKDEGNDMKCGISVAGAEFLQNRGFKALAQTTTNVKEFGNYRTLFPHKRFESMCRDRLDW